MKVRQPYRVLSARDLPPAIVLLVCVAAIAGFVWFVGPYQYLTGAGQTERGANKRAAENAGGPELNEFNFDNRYAGEIITGSIEKNECRKIIFNNNNGNMWDKGIVKCGNFALVDRAPTDPSVHLLEISKAFRYGEPASAAPRPRTVEAK